MSIDLDALVQTMRLTAGHMAPVVLMPHEALALVAEVERLRVERAEWVRRLVEAKKEGARSTVTERATERTAVVTWLGAEVDAAMEMHLPVRAATFLECAEAIERGAHRREETNE